jgi:hypothetical protein
LPFLGNPFPVQQHLQGGAQGAEAETLVFHFNYNRVVVGIGNVDQVIQIAVRHSACAENRLAPFEEVDDLVVAHLVSPVFPLPGSGVAPLPFASHCPPPSSTRPAREG